MCDYCDVSIHAPARGATCFGECSGFDVRRFNPRAREGRDAALKSVIYDIEVSIHAPARGATGTRKAVLRRQSFQSTRPRGARPHPFKIGRCKRKFQSTRPRGARPMRGFASGYF